MGKCPALRMRHRGEAETQEPTTAHRPPGPSCLVSMGNAWSSPSSGRVKAWLSPRGRKLSCGKWGGSGSLWLEPFGGFLPESQAQAQGSAHFLLPPQGPLHRLPPFP